MFPDARIIDSRCCKVPVIRRRCGDCGQFDSLSSKNKAAAACEHEAATPGTLPTLYELVDAARCLRRIFTALRTRWQAQAV